MSNRADRRNVYVLKNSPDEIEVKHKELKTKSVYLLKADDHIITKYRDIVYDFIDDAGLFCLVGQDKAFYQYFRKAMYKELRVEQERVHLISNESRVISELQVLHDHSRRALVLLEDTFDEHNTLPLLEEIKAKFKNVLVIALLNDSQEGKLANYVEAGADNIITKPVSVNHLIEKLANTLVPPDDIGKKVREGKMRLSKIEFALAYGVARDILQIKPGSPAGLLIMGDALKGLTKRDDALKMYMQAMENAEMYLEPLKKIVEFYKEEEDTKKTLEYLLRIDELSPLHVKRKTEIGEIFFAQKEIPNAAKYFEGAVKLLHQQKQPECVELAKKYAERIFEEEEMASEGLLTLATRLSKIYRQDAHWSLYNRLGMILRRRKNWKDAIKAYSEATKREPNDGSILFNLGMAYVEGKDFNNAADRFRKAITVSPPIYKDNLEAAYIIGQVFIRADKKKDAVTVLTHIHDVDPSFKKVKTLLKSLK